MLSQKYHPTYGRKVKSIKYKRKRIVLNSAIFALTATAALICHGFVDYSLEMQPGVSISAKNQSIVLAYDQSDELQAQIDAIKKTAFLPLFTGRLGSTNAGTASTTIPEFSYTGTYTLIDDGGGDWRIKFLTSGTFTPETNITVDVFLVGGGGSGGYGASTNYGSGGGSGYTTTSSGIVLEAGVSYDITIGAGGSTPSSGSDGNTGGTTTLAISGSPIAQAAGGYGGTKNGNPTYPRSAGASGGAANSTTSVGGYVGGSDGSTPTNGGTGQGTTTREFGEVAGTLYAAGGGACEYNEAQQYGGDIGGGNGAVTASSLPSTAGTANTGSGGGGAGSGNLFGGSTAGGSGIVVFRNHRT